jgi:hypothetical protein
MAESLRILILEDNPADAELVQFELQEAGILFIELKRLINEIISLILLPRPYQIVSERPDKEEHP